MRSDSGSGDRGGRPSKYRDEFADLARGACERGARDLDLAEMFGVGLRTISGWKVTHSAFTDALKVGKAVADDAVERSLFQRATGYSHDAVKFHVLAGEVVETRYVEHFPPDTTAAIFWLKNRRPAEWRDKQEFTNAVTVKQDHDFSKLNWDERQRMRALLLKARPEGADDLSAGPPA